MGNQRDVVGRASGLLFLPHGLLISLPESVEYTAALFYAVLGGEAGFQQGKIRAVHAAELDKALPETGRTVIFNGLPSAVDGNILELIESVLIGMLHQQTKKLVHEQQVKVQQCRKLGAVYLPQDCQSPQPEQPFGLQIRPAAALQGMMIEAAVFLGTLQPGGNGDPGEFVRFLARRGGFGVPSSPKAPQQATDNPAKMGGTAQIPENFLFRGMELVQKKARFFAFSCGLAYFPAKQGRMCQGVQPDNGGLG